MMMRGQASTTAGEEYMRVLPVQRIYARSGDRDEHRRSWRRIHVLVNALRRRRLGWRWGGGGVGGGGGGGDLYDNLWISATTSGCCVQRQAKSRRTAGANTQDPESGHALSDTLHPLCRRTYMKGAICPQLMNTA
jgi:hypothetical protein